ncbi:MAG TPA: GvpL/GvpF family gas vesicle protein [Chloroflexota bacterium]|nr:GvpL/GvpF family gas vesicle protein [Chloroflexota bacterium]
MPADLIYLYAIVAEDSPAATTLEAGDQSGLASSLPLFPVTAGGLAAIASVVPADLRELLDGAAAPPDLKRLAPFAVRHEETIRSLLPLAPALIPLGFGAVYRDRESVASFLNREEETLRRLLARLNQKEEWTLKVYRDEARAVAAAETASPALREIDAAITVAGPGRAHLLRKRREQVRQAAIEHAEQAVLEDVFAALASRAIAAQADEVLGEPGAAERLVLKVACLLARDDAPRFAEWLADLERARADDGLRMELTGPWAPYSFVRSAS